MANSESPVPPVVCIVTEHNEEDVAVARPLQHLTLKPAPKWPGLITVPIWATTSVPTRDNIDDVDGAKREVIGDMSIVQRNGTNCAVSALEPGGVSKWHRTSSLDHNILISGRLVLMMEDGSEYLIDQPGSIVVQRGTMHAWRNPGPGWARWVAVIVDAVPAVGKDGKILEVEAKD